MAKSLILILICTVFFQSSCSTVQLMSGVTSVPQRAFQSADPNQVTVAVVGINDFHGSLLPREKKLKTPQGEVMIKSGGASALASMIKILNQEMNGRLLIVDGGDEWQGTLESNQVKGASVVNFYNQLGVGVAAVGNHEFDFGLDVLQSRFKEAKYPYVAANIFQKKNGKQPRWKNFYPSRIFNVQGIKIGVVGVSTVHTPGTTRYEYVKDLDFKDPVPLVAAQSQILREQGAQAVLVTAHAGTFCEQNKTLTSWQIFSEKDEQGSCDDHHEISKLAQELKPGVLDGIVAGHTHQVQHHWINNTPVVQDEAFNQHFNVIYLTFDRATQKVIPSLTRIEGLVPICTQAFEGLNHCDVRRLKSGEAPKLVPFEFHGKKVEADSATEKWLKPIVAGTEKFRKQVVGISELPLTHYRDREGAFVNLVADAIREKACTDFSLANSGGIRTPLDAGPITFDGLFRALPFDNIVNVLRIPGRDVKLLYRIISAGVHGIAGFSGLNITLKSFKESAPSEDLNQNGTFEPWEVNRLLDIRKSDGSELIDDQLYTVATFDFLVNGGDDLHWFMSRLKPSQITVADTAYCRDIVFDYIQKRKVINTQSKPLFDPKNPRLIFR